MKKIIISIIILLSLTSVAIVNADVFVWKNVGVQPFGARDVDKAVVSFNLPNEVKIKFVIAAKGGLGKFYEIKIGQRFEQMVFGSYTIKNNIIVQIDPSQLKSKLYSEVYFEGYNYFLIKPDACSNWAWWKEKKEDVVIPQKKIVFSIREKNLVIIIPPKEELEEREEIVLPKEPERFYENETYGWVGRYWKEGASGSFSGGKHNSFFFCQDIKDFELFEGVGLMTNAWKGAGYRGDRKSIGPTIRVRKNEKTLTFSAQVGEQEDCWLGASKRTKLFCLTSDFSSGGLDAWGGINIDASHSEFLDKTYYLGSRFLVFEGEKIEVGILGKIDYAKEDFSFKNSVGIFMADDKKTFLLNLELQNISNSKYASSNGKVVVAGVDIDLKKVFYSIF